MPSSDGLSMMVADVALIIVESVLYGIYLVLFLPSLNFLVRRYREKGTKASLLLLVVSLVLLVLLTVHWSLDVAHACRCLFKATADETAACFVNLTDGLYLASSWVYITVTVIGDSFMVYRLYVVWGRGYWIILFPALIVIGVTGDSITIVVDLGASHANTPIWESAGNTVTAMFVLLLVDNLYCTALIAYKLWRSNLNLTSVGIPAKTTMKVAHVVVQSAALYSTCLALTLGFYLATSNAQFVLIAINTQVVGIVFCLIMLPGALNSTGTPNVTAERGSASNSMPLRRMAIRITTETHQDAEMGSMDPKAPPLELDVKHDTEVQYTRTSVSSGN
ncbi:hypothetical protein NM688_g951 [Phlebia brevispora]|uniref:Uncharacterized protein n=1 Tax=Phlebia brevispora TaxID=194682 RepID=A0ACC1TD36_9APHY|nr:hypothetical protein NM688_g951 [Phlebia brevispora]